MAQTRRNQRQRIEGLILSRIIALLENENTPNGDVFKAIALFCDHFRDAGGGDGGSVEVKFVE